MKNKFIKILFFCVLSLSYIELAFTGEFNFEISELEILDSGNVYKGNKRGKITTDNQIEIISNNFIYSKKNNRLELTGDVQIIDFKNDIKINAEKIFYLKNQENIKTLGKTKIEVFKKYTIEGYDLLLHKNEMVLSTNKEAVIKDNFRNTYTINKFEYYINQELLKAEKINFVTNDGQNNSDKFFFESAFIDLKEHKFLAKDISAKFHKTLFNNSKNDPRINAVSAYGDKSSTYFEKGVFTSCKKTDKCPPWKIKSREIKHDKIKKQIVYKNAWLEIYDFPVVYFPKFFHPDPSVKRQSGFLAPKLSSSQGLGDSIYTPYFYTISESKDVTIKPRLFNNNKFLLQNEYRQKTENSYTITDFSYTNAGNSNLKDKNNSRSHFFTNTKMDLKLEKFLSSSLEINFEKTSNDNYLKLFSLESPLLLQNNDVLESKIQLDLGHQNYDLTTSFEMYETLDGHNSDRYEYVLPSYNFSKNINLKNFDGNFNLNSYGSNLLNSTNIVTTEVFNDLSYNTNNTFFDNGIKSNQIVSFKNVNTMGKNNLLYRSHPQSEIMAAYTFNASYPLKKSNVKSLNILEPKLSFRFSPSQMKDNKLLERRMDVNNIFTNNRLSMDNSLEAGESITLGFDLKKEKINIKNEITNIEKYIEFKLATVFRANEENNLPQNSTLNKKQSNVFGQFNYNPTNNVSLNYNFSLTEDLDTFEYNYLNTKIDFNKLSTQFTYLEEKGLVGNTNIIESVIGYDFNDENSLSFKTRENRKLNLTEYYNLLYEYKNDCLIAGIQYNKNYYNDIDIKPVEELFFTITIIPLTTFSPDKMIIK
jgi:LPS-assembly protein|tara:strand:- start:2639 stop:5083 length:2445 start_codon:yes stop_codon:yes gene_type:complete